MEYTIINGKKYKSYEGENESWFQFNERIMIPKNGLPYMLRRTFISVGELFSIKRHEILQSDDRCSHDHPWPFVTFIFKGGYNEWTQIDAKDTGKYVEERIGVDGTVEVCHYHKPGSLMYRPAKWRHQLEMVTDKEGKGTPAITYVITGKVIREWGFFTKNGWMFWKNYDDKVHC
jgi:hypothetical protein